MIPGRYPRMAVFKSLRDVVQIPGLRKALKLILHSLLGGDRSPWDFAMQLPHYDIDDMPGISLDSGLHLVQLMKSKKFQLFDYKDAEVRYLIHSCIHMCTHRFLHKCHLNWKIG